MIKSLRRVEQAALAVFFIAGACDMSSGPDQLAADLTFPLTPVAAVTVTPPSAAVRWGETQQLTATPWDVDGNPLQDRLVLWTSNNPVVALVDQNGLVSSIAEGSAIITATSDTKSGTSEITVTARVEGDVVPGTITDLDVSDVTDTSVTLSFTEVQDGTGLPAKYDTRFSVAPISWGSAPSATKGSCATPVAGNAIGANRRCTLSGLRPSTGYQFQLVAFRGTLDTDAVFGGLSNVVSGTTLEPPTTPDTEPPAVSPSSGEPVFSAANGDALIYQDNMDQYTTPHAMDSWPGHALHPFYPDRYPNNYDVITSAHGGVGKALRLVYTKGNGDRFIWKTNPENSSWYAPTNAAFVLQYWFRISKNGGPGGGPGYGATDKGMKWVEFWNLGQSVRTQFSVTAGNATTGPLWHVNPASRGQFGFQPVGPYWNQLNNNQWHRVTYVYQPNSAPGATDGIARMWIDGTKIVDISAAAAGVTPTGGTKVWCTLAEVGQLDVAPTGTINLGEYMNGGLGDGVTDLPMTLDFDDFMWWRLPVRIP